MGDPKDLSMGWSVFCVACWFITGTICTLGGTVSVAVVAFTIAIALFVLLVHEQRDVLVPWLVRFIAQTNQRNAEELKRAQEQREIEERAREQRAQAAEQQRLDRAEAQFQAEQRHLTALLAQLKSETRRQHPFFLRSGATRTVSAELLARPYSFHHADTYAVFVPDDKTQPIVISIPDKRYVDLLTPVMDECQRITQLGGKRIAKNAVDFE